MSDYGYNALIRQLIVCTTMQAMLWRTLYSKEGPLRRAVTNWVLRSNRRVHNITVTTWAGMKAFFTEEQGKDPIFIEDACIQFYTFNVATALHHFLGAAVAAMAAEKQLDFDETQKTLAVTVFV